MNLAETYLRAEIINGLSKPFGRLGYKTEARLLRIQSELVTTTINKAIAEMPNIEPWEAIAALLGGGMTPAQRLKRQVRGKYMKIIGDAERTMLKTLRRAFENLYKAHEDWPRRKQIATTTMMMKGIMNVPKEKVQEELAAMRVSKQLKK